MDQYDDEGNWIPPQNQPSPVPVDPDALYNAPGFQDSRYDAGGSSQGLDYSYEQQPPRQQYTG